MARLTIQNVAAPNLSGTSQILANAAASLNTGLSAASSVLDKYTAGQQESADASILSKIASLKSEEELSTFLGSGQIDNLNVSPKMRETILGLRNGIIAQGQARANISQTQAQTRGTDANTTSTLASTAIRNAAEGRTAAEYTDSVNARNERRGLTGQVVAANREGNQQGQPTNRNEVANAAYQGLIDRGLPAHVAEGFVMNFQDESGFVTDRVEEAPNVHGTRGKGIYQLTGSRRDAYEARYGQDYSLNNQLDWLVSELQGSESSAGQRILNTATAGEAGAAIVTNFLRPAEQHRASRAARYLNSQGSNARPAFNNLQQAIKNSVYMEPDDAQRMLADAYAAQSLGQQRIDNANTAAQQEASAAAILAAVQDPTKINQQQLVMDLINNPAIGNSNERISAIARAQGLAGEDGPLSQVLAPRVSTDETIKNSIELFNGREGANIASSVQTRLLNDAQKYNEDPSGTLIEQLNINPRWQNIFDILGKEERASFNNRVRRMINNLAQETGVRPSLVATALADNFTGNDSWFFDPLEDRFDLSAAKSFIEANLSENALSRFNEQRVVSESRQRQVGALRLQLDTLRSQAAKYGANVPPALAQNIQSLQTQILTATNGSIPEPTSGTQSQAPIQQDAGGIIANAATPQPVVQQPTIQLPAAQNNSIPQGQSEQVQLEPDAFDTKLTLEEAEYNRVQLRDYIETSGYREQLSATQPGSADRQLIIEALARRIQDDTRLTDAEKQGLLSAIAGGN